MKKSNRIIFLVAVLLLTGSYFFPIWQILLEAPQYPEGLGLYIHIDEITGLNDNDLNNINNLNHYIGMKRIEPETIQELKLMPYLIGAMIVMGIGVSYFNKKKLYVSWVILLFLLLIAGLIDFYLWEYDYGHNLDPKAAIKIPGMSYQPPLIGVEKLLNITAISMPHIGGFLVGISLLLALFALLKERMNLKKQRLQVNAVHGLAAIIFLIFSGCNYNPEEIDIKRDKCSYCEMNIADIRFAAQAITTKGKIYKYDAIECLAGHLNEDTTLREGIKALYVHDFRNSEKWVTANEAFFLKSEKIKSPMGMFLSAFSEINGAEQAKGLYGGVILRWNDVVDYVKSAE